MRITSDPYQGVDGGVASAIWEPGANVFLGQPSFVPKDGSEASGWLLMTMYNADTMTSKLAVLDSDDIGGGPVASIRFPDRLAHGPLAQPYHVKRLSA